MDKYAAVGTYSITVKVTDNDLGEAIQILEAVLSPPPPPAAPSGLRVDFVAMNRIQIVWTDNLANEDGFIVESCAQRGCNNFIEIGRVFPDIRHFVHNDLFPNTQYYYITSGRDLLRMEIAESSARGASAVAANPRFDLAKPVVDRSVDHG